MFTGLVQDIGRLVHRVDQAIGAKLRVSTCLEPLEHGESVAVMGVCLTVHRVLDGAFEADVSAETLARTTLGKLRVGAAVHLERALRLSDRVGGHLVSGHVDAVGWLRGRATEGEGLRLSFGYDRSLAPFLASKGSIGIDGVSLTINGLSQEAFDVMVVPHTQRQTLLGKLEHGDPVNLEADLLARYVVRWFQVGGSASAAQETSEQSLLARLASSGYL